MSDLQSFLQEASTSIGVSGDSARSGTSAILDLVRQQAGEADFGELVDKLPGAASLLSGAQDTGDSKGGGGLLGGLGGAVSGALGSKLGGAASVLGAFESSGLDLKQSTSLVTMFFAFAKSSAGSEIVERILGKMPEIKKLIG